MYLLSKMTILGIQPLVFGGVFYPKVMDEFGFVACEFAIG